MKAFPISGIGFTSVSADKVSNLNIKGKLTKGHDSDQAEMDKKHSHIPMFPGNIGMCLKLPQWFVPS